MAHRRRPARRRPPHARASPAPTWPTSSTRPRCSPPAPTRSSSTTTSLDEAIDRVIAGPQKRTRIMSAKERKITAYHEGGHALVAAAMNHTDPVTKVTILPRGRALGYTMVMPTDDKYSTTRNEILDQLAYALGGRVAEEIIFHDPTTGAANDIEKATAMARKMVTEYGMSERVGAIKLGQSQGEVFLGRDMGHQRDYSEEVAGVVDEEVRKLVDDAHDEAWHVDQRQPRRPRPPGARAAREARRSTPAELAEIFDDVRKRPVRPTVAVQRAPHRCPTSRRCSRRPSRRRQRLNGATATATAPPIGATVTPGTRATQAEIDAGRRGRAPTRRRGAPPDPGDRGAGRWPCRALTEDYRRAASGPSTSPAPRRPCASCSSPIGEDPDREGLRRHPRPGGPGLRARLFAGLWPGPGRRAREDVLDRPRRDDHRARHPGVLARASTTSCPFHGVAHIGYIPADGRPGHRPVASSPGSSRSSPAARRCRSDHHPDRRRARRAPRRPGRHRRRRVRAPVHVDARRPQAGLAHHHLRRARPAARPRHPRRGDVAAARRQAVTGR